MSAPESLRGECSSDDLAPALAVGAPRWPVAVLLSLSAAGLCTLALTVAARAPYPWPLEWMEGATLQHALRLLHGQPLYAAPSAEFIPYLYPPLAYVPMAAAAALLGSTLPAARAASIVCSALALALIGRAASRAARAAAAGWAAAGLFAIGFGYTGAFLDLARVDAGFVLLVAAGAERLTAERPRAALAWLALSALAKQHGLILFVAVALALVARDAARARSARDADSEQPAAPAGTDRRPVWPAAALCALLLAAASLGLSLASAGWYGRYTFALPARHGAEPALFFSFFAVDLAVYLPVLVASAAWALRRPRAWGPFEALLAAALIAGALGRAHPGGHDNVRLPAFALLCIAGVAPLCRSLLAPQARMRRRLALATVLALQFALLWQAPGFHAPPPHGAERFAELRGALQRCARGDRAVALDHALLTGEPFVHTMALSDLRMAGGGLARAGTDALFSGLRGSDAPAAIAVGERFPALDRVLAAHYRLCAELPSPPLPTGYTPGAAGSAGKLQRIYARADL